MRKTLSCDRLPKSCLRIQVGCRLAPSYVKLLVLPLQTAQPPPVPESELLSDCPSLTCPCIRQYESLSILLLGWHEPALFTSAPFFRQHTFTCSWYGMRTFLMNYKLPQSDANWAGTTIVGETQALARKARGGMQTSCVNANLNRLHPSPTSCRMPARTAFRRHVDMPGQKCQRSPYSEP